MTPASTDLPNSDLAQNWDVDIASSLEEYLEDLEEVTITLDGGASKVNFAEAALLIQVGEADPALQPPGGMQFSPNAMPRRSRLGPMSGGFAAGGEALEAAFLRPF